MEVTREIAAKVLEIVDAGLVKGMGNPTPGQMCVEAAVCYAMGEPHGDEPKCVAPSLRRLKIRLNDARWSSDLARAKGMRRLALVQLGSAGVLDQKEFARRVAELAIKTCVPRALRAAASVQKDEAKIKALMDAAKRCEQEGTREAALEAKRAAAAGAGAAAYAAAAAYAYAAAAADAYAYAAAAADAAADAAAAAAADAAAGAAAGAAAARDKELSTFAEDVVQILIGMDVPGAQWLDLAPVAA